MSSKAQKEHLIRQNRNFQSFCWQIQYFENHRFNSPEALRKYSLKYPLSVSLNWPHSWGLQYEEKKTTRVMEVKLITLQ